LPLVLVALAIATLCGCNDKSANPDPEPVRYSSDYPVYFIDDISQLALYEYYPGTDSIHKTAIDLGYTCGLVVGYGGERLYADNQYHGLRVVDLVTKELDTALTISGRPAISPDGSRLVLAADSLYILDALSLAIVHTIDTIAARSLCFSADGNRLYVPVSHNGRDTLLATVQMDQPDYPVTIKSLLNAIPDLTEVTDLCLSPDESTLYLCGDAGGQFFAAIDVAQDTLIATQPLFDNPAQGRLAMTPDGARVFAPHPTYSISHGGLIPPPELFVYDAAIGSISCRHMSGLDLLYLDTWHVDSLSRRDIAVTPDGRWLVCTSMPFPFVLLFDAYTLELVHAFTDHNLRPGYLACQRYGPPPPRPIDTTGGTR
jgi:hypothetical protein